MHYAPLFTLRLEHPYYQDGLCPDCAVVPTPECERLLRDHRIVLKPDRAGIRGLAPVDTSGQWRFPPAGDTLFRFALHLQNPRFHQFTDPVAGDAVFTAGEKERAQEDGFIKLQPIASPYTEEFQLEEAEIISETQYRRWTLRNQPGSGLRIADFALDIHRRNAKICRYDAAKNQVYIDSAGQQSGKVVISYPRPRLPWGDLTHVALTLSDRAEANHFKLLFSARKMYWVYCLVTDGASVPEFVENKTELLVAPDSAVSMQIAAMADGYEIEPMIAGIPRPEAQTIARGIASLAAKLRESAAIRYLIYSTEPIPRQERYVAYPQLTLDEQNYPLLPPSLGADPVQLIRVRSSVLNL